mgnify:CR=1 FL=1
MTETEVARLFGIGDRTLRTWRRQLRRTGELTVQPHKSGNKARVGPEHEQVVREIVATEPDATVEETAALFVLRTSIPCSRSAMGRALRRLDLTRKKRR